MQQRLSCSSENRNKVPRSLFMSSAKKNQMKRNRLLISVTVMGSAGPLRFLVNADEMVMSVIEQTLKSYAHVGRRPILGSDFNNFLLYCANGVSDALCPRESIGSYGGRNFILCKKQGIDLHNGEVAVKASCGWKFWLNNLFTSRFRLVNLIHGRG